MERAAVRVPRHHRGLHRQAPAQHAGAAARAYQADITYGTNNEFGFDYLRDNMARDPEELVQRKHHYAMVDEVDSVLIDDARTPLIISGPVPRGDVHEFYQLKPRIQRLVDEQKKIVQNYLVQARKLIAEGKTGAEEGDKNGEGGLMLFRAYRGLPKSKPLIKFLSETRHARRAAEAPKTTTCRTTRGRCPRPMSRCSSPSTRRTTRLS